MDHLPVIVYDMSVVDEYVRTFFEHPAGGVNDVIFESIFPFAVDSRHLLFSTDSVGQVMRNLYADRKGVLDSIFNATYLEPVSVPNHTQSVFTLLSIYRRTKQPRPLKFLTMDPQNRKTAISSGFDVIDAAQAIQLIAEAKAKEPPPSPSPLPSATTS